MATSLACRLGLPCRVDTPPGRGIVPGASDAPRHRSVRAHATSSKGAGEAGDDVRNVRLGSKNNNNHVLSHDPTPSVVPLRAGSAAPPADEWIRVVVDSVHLDDAPFEHREARNFRSAGGEAHQTVRVLTALLRTVTDGKDLLLPLVASALVSDPLADSLAGRVTKVKDGDFDRDRSDVQPQPLDANDEETMDDTSHGYRRPYFFVAPPRRLHPSTRVQTFESDEVLDPEKLHFSATTCERDPSNQWPPRPLPLRLDPLEMCHEYLHNCLRSERPESGATWRKKRTVTFSGGHVVTKSSTQQHISDSNNSNAFNAYGSDTVGLGMHQDVGCDDTVDDQKRKLTPLEKLYDADKKNEKLTQDEFDSVYNELEAMTKEPASDVASLLDGSNAIEDTWEIDRVRFRLERRFDAERYGRSTRENKSKPHTIAPPPLAKIEINPKDVDDMLDTLEDLVETRYLVIDVFGDGSNAARSTATLYAKPRDASFDASSDDDSFLDTSLENKVRPVGFDVYAWSTVGDAYDSLAEGSGGRAFFDSYPQSTSIETHITGLESILALCASLKRNVPIFVAKKTLTKFAVAPNAWRSSFRSVERMGSSDDFRYVRDGLGHTRHANGTSGTTGTTGSAQTSSTSKSVIPSDAILNLSEETAPSDPDALDAFDDFLRSAVRKLKNDVPDKNDPYLPPLQSLMERSKRDKEDGRVSEATSRGPVVFFRECRSLFLDWYKRAKWFHDTIVELSMIAKKNDKSNFLALRHGSNNSVPLRGNRAKDALRRLTGKNGDLASNAVSRSVGAPGKVTSLDRRKLDYTVSARVSVACLLRRRKMLTDLMSVSSRTGVIKPGKTPLDETVQTGAHVFIGALFRDEWSNVDPEARVLVTKWSMAFNETATDHALRVAELTGIERALFGVRVDVDGTEDEGLVEVESREQFNAVDGTKVTVGVAIQNLELAILYDRFEDASTWLLVLSGMNRRCVDHEAVFGKEK